MNNKPEVKVSVLSDYICPFCFIGHRRLAKLREHYNLKVQWCFVEIHPETPSEGQSVKLLNYSEDYWNHLMQALMQLAQEEDIQLAEHTMTTNSRRALLLAETTKLLGPEKFYPLHERLFEAYFVEGQNIGDEKVLREIAQECQIPEATFEKAWHVEFANGPAESTPQPLLPYLQYAGAIKAENVPTFIFGREMLTGVVSQTKMMQMAEDFLKQQQN